MLPAAPSGKQLGWTKTRQQDAHLPADPGPWTTPEDTEPQDDHDRLADPILRNDLTWTLDLDAPHRWLPAGEPADA